MGLKLLSRMLFKITKPKQDTLLKCPVERCPWNCLLLLNLLLWGLPVSAQRSLPDTLVLSEPVRPLPGQLDQAPLLNSNSPELVREAGILLSTFPPANQRQPEAHLDYPVQGDFGFFAHHVTQPFLAEDTRTLYQALLLHNPNSTPANVEILAGASYLSQPDAPFITLREILSNFQGRFFAGPGSRVMNEVLRGLRQPGLPDQAQIAAQSSYLLLNVPIPTAELDPPLNGRSSYIRLHSEEPLYAASLAMFAPQRQGGPDILQSAVQEEPPSLSDWQALLNNGRLVQPRDLPPTSPDDPTPNIIYGRVAGVSQGLKWDATLEDPEQLNNAVQSQNSEPQLTIPKEGEAIAYGLSTLPGGTFGTGQVQSAPMLARYPDTAYSAHGNYALQYHLQIPLYNPTSVLQTVTLAIHTPLKADQASTRLTFLPIPGPEVFFRGTVRVRYRDDRYVSQNRYFHLVQQRGQWGDPLVKVNLAPDERRPVTLDFFYPPDATPPQVLAIKTLDRIAAPPPLFDPQPLPSTSTPNAE